jgi:hypothetical protein
MKKKKQECPTWLGVCALISVLFVICLMCSGDSEPETPKLATDIIAIEESRAVVICNSYAKSTAIYQYKSTWNKVTMKKDGSWFIYMKGTQFQNAFGAFRKVDVYCEIPVTGRRDLVDYYSSDLIIDYITK